MLLKSNSPLPSRFSSDNSMLSEARLLLSGWGNYQRHTLRILFAFLQVALHYTYRPLNNYRHLSHTSAIAPEPIVIPQTEIQSVPPLPPQVKITSTVPPMPKAKQLASALQPFHEKLAATAAESRRRPVFKTTEAQVLPLEFRFNIQDCSGLNEEV